MPLTPGSRIGAYDIVGSIGAGGMGEVYRARDAKLNRDVAIKVLPELFARDPERLSRFEREAQALAALSHPNIAQIYGVVGDALVMELVEGEDLAQRISRGAIPIDDTLAIATQIASALEAAHERGIIHRDLKPANVKVTPDGTVKVLDFGLAKMAGAGDAVISNSPTFTSPATAVGVILGTAAYMAPEQARGKTVDRRADIWAFGCLLYEMLTARHAFGGETVTDTLSAIVSREPDLTALPAEAPPAVRRLLVRCLEKDPRKRLQAIGEARIALDETSAPEPVAPLNLSRASGLSPIAAAGLAIAGAVLGALGIWLATRPAPVATPPPLHLSLSLAPAGGLDGAFSLSPDGQTLAFVGIVGTERQIFLRRLDREQAEPLNGTQGGAGLAPVFSPDGKWLAFLSGGLKKIPIDGGPATGLSTQPVVGTRMAWGADGTIVFTDRSLGLSRIPSAGGAAETLTTLDPTKSELTHEMPWFLPDGKTLLFNIRTPAAANASGSSTIVALTLASGERRQLFPGLVLGAIGDRLIIQRENAILAVPFDFTRLTATGDPVPFLSQQPSFQRMVFATTPLFAVARNGTVVVSPRSIDEENAPLVMVEPGGKATRLNLPVHRYSDPRLSPDGTRIAVHVFEEMRDNWIADLRRGTFMRLTFDSGEDETPCWSPDGRWVYWTASRAKLARVIYRKAADGTGPEQEIWKGTAHIHIGGMTPDGATLIIGTVGQATQILAVNVADGKERPLVTTPFTNEQPAVSPDGNWLAYASNESGRSEIYVQPYPSLQGRTQISAAGGGQPVWARTGSRLYYRGSEKIMAVDVARHAMSGGIEASPPTVVMDDTYESTQGAGHTSYDVTRDGRFLMIGKRPAAQGSVTHLKIIYAGR